jgi:hypothetical protein
MGATQSTNRHAGLLSGYGTRWQHNDGARTSTITPQAGKIVVFHRIIINTTSATAITIRDSVNGVIGVLKASVSEGTYVYSLPIKGNLIVENPGTSDITIVFSNN